MQTMTALGSCGLIKGNWLGLLGQPLRALLLRKVRELSDAASGQGGRRSRKPSCLLFSLVPRCVSEHVLSPVTTFLSYLHGTEL